MTIREGDLEAVSREMDRRGRPKEGRVVIDPKGNKVHFDVNSNGNPRIRHYEGERD